MDADLPSKFAAVNGAGVPDIHTLSEDRLRCLWVLHVAKSQLHAPWMSATQVGEVLRDTYGINISRQRCASLLAADKREVANRRVGNRQEFQVMKPGSDAIIATRSVVFIEPAAALTALREVQDMFGSLKGEVRVCDPYVDGRTLDMLAHLEHAESVKLLSMNVKDKGGLVRDTKAFIAEHGTQLEIRLGPKGHLHDRYLIHNDGMLLIGTSLNSIGLKQSFVVSLGADIRASVLTSFDTAWNLGNPLA